MKLFLTSLLLLSVGCTKTTKSVKTHVMTTLRVPTVAQLTEQKAKGVSCSLRGEAEAVDVFLSVKQPSGKPKQLIVQKLENGDSVRSTSVSFVFEGLKILSVFDLVDTEDGSIETEPTVVFEAVPEERDYLYVQSAKLKLNGEFEGEFSVETFTRQNDESQTTTNVIGSFSDCHEAEVTVKL